MVEWAVYSRDIPGAATANAGVAKSVGVVIPCRGDAQLLRRCLASLSDFIAAGDRVVVVNADHCATASTIAIDVGAEVAFSDSPDRGRAVAAGVACLLSAKSAAPDVILIAHADMEFMPDSRKALIRATGPHARRQWGAMGHAINSRDWTFRIVEAGNRLRASFFQTPYGDQAMFFGVELLADSGGFPQQNRLEDYELSLRLRPIARPLYVNYPVRISDRHWRRGIIRTSVRNWFTAINYIMTRAERHSTPNITPAPERLAG